MMRWALLFALMALVAGAYGFTGEVRAATAVAQLFFFLTLTLALIFLISGLAPRPRARP
jgi:uncharacterized membrane protein YtjA (UPF0391 family)